MRDTLFGRFLQEFTRNKVATGAAIVVFAIVFIALIAPLVTPQDPYDLANLVLRDARRAPGTARRRGRASELRRLPLECPFL